MKLKFVLLLFLWQLVAERTVGQGKRSVKFVSINQLAVTFGDRNIGAGGPGIFSTNGFETDKWFAGLGVGYNNYAMHSYPLYLQAERKFSQLKYGFFAFANSGLNVVLQKDQVPAIITVTSNSRYKFETGYWGEMGIGHRFYIFKNLQMQAAVGYNYHTFKTTETLHPQIQGQPITTRRYTEKINALLLRFGVRI